jgi:hypothetical protein
MINVLNTQTILAIIFGFPFSGAAFPSFAE